MVKSQPNIRFNTIKIICFIFICIIGCAPKAKPEIFLIPHRFEGTIIIFFGIENGQKETDDKGVRIHQIPESGVLYSEFEFISGELNQTFFYVDSIGNRVKEIKHTFKEHVYQSELPYIMDMKDGTAHVISKVNNDTLNRIKYLYFSIGSFKDKEKLNKESYEFARQEVKKLIDRLAN